VIQNRSRLRVGSEPLKVVRIALEEWRGGGLQADGVDGVGQGDGAGYSRTLVGFGIARQTMAYDLAHVLKIPVWS